MTLKDMIITLRFNTHLTIRSKENYDLCEMDSNSEAIKYFENKTVSQWFPCNIGLSSSGFVVYLEGDEEDASGES